MINILIKDYDVLYRHGMENFLTDLFIMEFGQLVEITHDFNRESVSQADIIVMAFCKGESFICLPEFQSRQKSLVIGLVEQAFVKSSALAGCISDAFFLERSAPLETIRRTVIHHWSRLYQPNGVTFSSNCYTCRHRNLSWLQAKIMVGIYNGKNSKQISAELNVNEKTVYSHKYVVMNKFDLKSDYELLLFLNKLKEKQSVKNSFKYCLENMLDPNNALIYCS